MLNVRDLVDEDLPRATQASVINPDPDGNGVAFNGKPIFSVEQAIKQLNPEGFSWQIKPNNQITYTFLEHDPDGAVFNNRNGDYAEGGYPAYVAGFAPFTAAQRETAREAMELWDDLIAPDIVEKRGRGAADIKLFNTNTGPAQASAFRPAGSEGREAYIDGHAQFNQDVYTNSLLAYGGYGQETLVHEIGHALALSHPGDYNFSDDRDGDGKPDPITYQGDAFYYQDSKFYTTMSYFDPHETGAGVSFVNWSNGGWYMGPQTPQLHDIAAIQAAYGADMTTRTGDTVYGYNSTANRGVFDFTQNELPFLTIWDAGGHDTLDFSGFRRNAVLDLRAGEFSSGYGLEMTAAEFNELYGVSWTQARVTNWLDSWPLVDNIAIAYGVVIEDGVGGSGADRITGNHVNNRLDGGAGADVIDGLGGSDVLIGGAGADRFVFTTLGGTDRIIDFVSGTDRIDLRGLDAKPASTADDAFAFVAAFTGKAGEAVLTFDAKANTSRLQLDVNGDGRSDLDVLINGSTTGADWLL